MSYFNKTVDGQAMPLPNTTPDPEDSAVFYPPAGMNQVTWNGLTPGMKRLLGVKRPSQLLDTPDSDGL